MLMMWAFNWFAWYNTSWRNSGIVARAAHFVKRTRYDRRCASALETVSRHPALMEELAEVLSLSDDEGASLVRTRLSDIQEGMHEFMRLAGVSLKDKVTCQPSVDGRKQLHDLNEYCWGVREAIPAAGPHPLPLRDCPLNRFTENSVEFFLLKTPEGDVVSARSCGPTEVGL
ncbi:hypothetical protein MTO96_037277 [Rhipicephalus appendiculatus]